MTALKTLQSDAISALAALVTQATTGIKSVLTEVPDALPPLPCLIISESPDGGVNEQRDGQFGVIRWDLDLRVYLALSPSLAKAQEKMRDIRADLIDRLDGDITLGGKVHNTIWRGSMRITTFQFGADAKGNPILYAGIYGGYTLIFKVARSYA